MLIVLIVVRPVCVRYANVSPSEHLITRMLDFGPCLKISLDLSIGSTHGVAIAINTKFA